MEPNPNKTNLITATGIILLLILLAIVISYDGIRNHRTRDIQDNAKEQEIFKNPFDFRRAPGFDDGR